ncbi:uncharacterized protein LOC107850348 isoform X2 [Capsicum annuum]|uniref:uncharacterized protein LOC107850348 isoform X2 n=1 Tax=Capsicum annuum TaxID=4072 RepID=UPI001FB0A797|nr:uncharacterized protein LOC107850348 isoform X2 [Capsicum annuum]
MNLESGYHSLEERHVKEKAFSKCFCRNAAKLLRGSNGSELGVPNSEPQNCHHICSVLGKTVQIIPCIVPLRDDVQLFGTKFFPEWPFQTMQLMVLKCNC